MLPTKETAVWWIPLLVLLACGTMACGQAQGSNPKQADDENSSQNLLRKSIVFDLKTPKVFYCPQEKPAAADKMIVKAQPLDKLCEYDRQPRPKGAKSDCYNDVDESEFACDEKRRFMIRLDLAGEVDTTPESMRAEDLEHILAKGPTKKKTSPGGKKY